MITALELKFGSTIDSSALRFNLPPSVTVFVGPNNSGKSQALREIVHFCSTGDSGTVTAIINKLEFESMGRASALEAFEKMKVQPRLGERVADGHALLRIGRKTIQAYVERYINARVSPQNDPAYFASAHCSHYILNLDGPSRVNLLNPQARGDLKNPESDFARLLTDDQKRSALRKIIYDAIRLYFAIDASVGDQLAIRFAEAPPPDERSFNDQALEYMRNSRDLGGVSDGVKAFTGMLLQLHVGDPKIIVVDEPEAFLHPSLAATLGKELAKGAVEEGKHLFVATHSPQFVMGAILSGAKVNIVRLTYSNGKGTARLLSSDELTVLMQDPLLRSVNLLAGLFYDYVIVGEADADRAFYQEINERLLATGDPRAIPHALFLNAQGKDTIARIVEPLRKLGIPTAPIVDLDVLQEGGTNWTRHLKACNVPAAEYDAYGTRRSKVFNALMTANPKFKISGGISLLNGSDLEAAENLVADLARYGCFVVSTGEVEAWLSTLNVTRSKQTWLRSIFEKMGSDPRESDYVRPTAGDVWNFIGDLRAWLVDNNRRGIPS